MPLELKDMTFENDLEALLRLQDVLLSAVEGARDAELDHEYRELRGILLEDPSYQEVIPKLVKRYRDLGSLWPALKNISPQWEPRRVEVRNQFEDALTLAERLELQVKPGDFEDGYNAAAWTGATTPRERIKAVKTLMPIAQNAVECLIASLSSPRHNGGPPLDETELAIENLRKLHASIGQILVAAEEGKLFESSRAG